MRLMGLGVEAVFDTGSARAQAAWLEKISAVSDERRRTARTEAVSKARRPAAPCRAAAGREPVAAEGRHW